MKNKRILALISSVVVLTMGITLSYNIIANAENSAINDYSNDTSNEDEPTTDDNSEDTENSQDSEDTTTSSNSNELQLLKYSDFSTDFINKIVIVGDSIASGFATYDRLPQSQVLATGSVGARNIHSFDFTVDDKSMDILDAISIKQPQYIFMSMGMNDVNLSSSDEYIENYNKNIDDIRSICPKSTIIVLGITPVISYSDFTSNDTLDTYNEALKLMAKNRRDGGEKTYYINVGTYLKDDQNSLKSEFSSGDGIHLDKSAYDYIFTCMINSINCINS